MKFLLFILAMCKSVVCTVGTMGVYMAASSHTEYPVASRGSYLCLSLITLYFGITGGNKYFNRPPLSDKKKAKNMAFLFSLGLMNSCFTIFTVENLYWWAAELAIIVFFLTFVLMFSGYTRQTSSDTQHEIRRYYR